MKNWACILIAIWALGCGSNAPSGNLPKENYTHPQSSDNLSLADSECTTEILAKTAHSMNSLRSWTSSMSSWKLFRIAASTMLSSLNGLMNCCSKLPPGILNSC